MNPEKLSSFLKSLFLSKTALSIYLVFSGNLFSALFSFLFTVIVSRSLTLSDLGIFSSLLSVLMFVTDMSDAGLATSFLAILPRHSKNHLNQNRYIKAGFIIQIVIALSIFCILILLSHLIADTLLHDTKLFSLVILTAFANLSSTFAGFYQFTLAALQKFKKLSFLYGFGGFIRLMLILILISTGSLTLYTAIGLHIVQMIIIFIVGGVLLNRSFWIVKLSVTTELLKFSIPIAIAKSLNAITARIDIILLITLSSSTEAGIYSISARVISIFPLLLGSLLTVIAPKFSSLKDKADIKKFVFKVSLISSVFIVGCAILMIFSPTFMRVLFQEKGEFAINSFRLLLVGQIFYILSIPSISLITYVFQKNYALTVNSLIQFITIISLSFILIPKYGNIGASICSIGAYGVSALYLIFMSTKYFRGYKAWGD